jgi:hypothetical protein
MAMSEFIRNLDVSFEIVSPAGIDFTTPKEVKKYNSLKR